MAESRHQEDQVQEKEDRPQEQNPSQNAPTAITELHQAHMVTENILRRILKIKEQQLDLAAKEKEFLVQCNKLAAKEKEFLVQCNKELSKEVDDLRVEKSQLLEKMKRLEYGVEK